MGLISSSARIYAYFVWLAPAILKIFPGLPSQLRASGKGVYPEVYAAFVGFAVTSSIASSVAVSILLQLLGLPILYSLLVLAAPVLVLFLTATYPWFLAKNRAASLDSETPYAAAYISVMATGAVTPYTSLQRLRRVDLMPSVAALGGYVEAYAKARGVDPVTAMEKAADAAPSEEIRDLFKGYASTLRMGGDATNYLLRRTELIFQKREARVRAVGERMAIITEAYLAVGILLALGVFMMFIVSKALPIPTQLLGLETFITFSYAVLPLISMIFVYLADVLQPKYPSGDNRPYLVLGMTSPFFVLSLVAFSAPELFPQLESLTGPLRQLRESFMASLGLDRGFDVAIGVAVSLIILFLPAAVTEVYLSLLERGILRGITRFLREMVEVRKTGLSPERCIETLARGSYGRFTPILRVMANKLAWGSSYERIFRYVEGKIKHWISKVSLYILFDAIEVGGGTPETLDALSRFNEQMETIEYSKRSSLRPLLLIPYIGALILIFTSIVLLGYMRNSLLIAGRIFAYDAFLRLFLPPLILNVALMGIVAGKVSEERVAAGFKHAVQLLLVSMLALIASPYLMNLLSPVAG